MRRMATTPCSSYHLRGESAEVTAEAGTAEQQLLGGSRPMRGTVFRRNPMLPALLAPVFAQQLTAAGIEYAYPAPIPLHLDLTADPARRRTVVSGFDFDTTVEVDPAVAKRVMPEGLGG